MQCAPQRSRSAVLRVTTVRSCRRLVAAIRLSMTGSGAPRASDAPTIAPQRAAARASIASTRSWNRSVSSPCTQLSSLILLAETGSLAMPLSNSPRVMALKNKSSSSHRSIQATTEAFGRGRTSSEMTHVSSSQLTTRLVGRCHGCASSPASPHPAGTCERTPPDRLWFFG